MSWDLSEEQQQLILNGTNEEVEFTVQKDNRKFSFQRGYEGVIPNLERRSREYERRKREEGGDEEPGTAAQRSESEVEIGAQVVEPAKDGRSRIAGAGHRFTSEGRIGCATIPKDTLRRDEVGMRERGA